MDESTSNRGSERLSRIIGAALVLFACAGLAVGLVRELRGTDGVEREEIAAAAPNAAIIYYFHGHTRCEACLEIERRTAEVVQSQFVEETASGRLVHVSLDFDEPRYRHYREKFILSFGAVVVAHPGDGDWECLNDVWTLIEGEPSEFDRYVAEGIRRHLPASAATSVPATTR